MTYMLLIHGLVPFEAVRDFARSLCEITRPCKPPLLYQTGAESRPMQSRRSVCVAA